MRINSLKFTNFKSIERFEHTFNYSFFDTFTPICFVGLNGSGKSNVLEAISEIFAYLDLYSLDYKISDNRKKSPLTFEIEYCLKIEGHEQVIGVKANKNQFPQCTIKNGDQERTLSESEVYLYLPEYIIGYSSGDNELISYSFMKNYTEYNDEVYDTAKQEKDEQYKENYKEKIRSPKSLFIDANLGQLIFLVNEIFLNDETSTIKNIYQRNINIEKIKKFSLTIKIENTLLTKELQEIIDNLILCSSANDGNIKNGLNLSYFLIDPTVKMAFQSIFENPIKLFSSLNKLILLNFIKFSSEQKNLFKSNKPVALPKLSTIAPDNKIFSFQDLDILLCTKQTIDYEALSDGEHQLLLILGLIQLFDSPNTLFILDEPESHFNPQWRTMFVSLVEQISLNLRQNLLLSTHSPYIVSACKKENVIKFTRNYETGEIEYKSPMRETFGSTFDQILYELFDMSSKISQYSKQYIYEILEKTLDEMETAVFELAESPEKLLLYDAIYDLTHKRSVE
jgi:restriction system-associated AAA family ATPase